MGRKTRVKPLPVKAANGKLAVAPEDVGDKKPRKYLTPKFTRQLVKHMHRAKKAALKDRE